MASFDENSVDDYGRGAVAVLRLEEILSNGIGMESIYVAKETGMVLIQERFGASPPMEWRTAIGSTAIVARAGIDGWVAYMRKTHPGIAVKRK